MVALIMVIPMAALAGNAFAADVVACPQVLDFHVRPLLGEDPVHLCNSLQGRLVLIVDTASECVYTPQYEGV